MKTLKNLLVLGHAFICALYYTQIGINTPTPAASLDVNGNLVVRNVPGTPDLSGQTILTLNQSNNEINQLTTDAFSPSTNTTIAKARATSNLSLLAVSAALFDTSWSIVKFDNTSINTSNFTSTASDFYYTVPTTGKYIIDFNFKNSVALGLATGPQIGILRTPLTGSAVLLDSKSLNGIGISLISSYYFETINSVYELEAGDKIRFVYNKGSLGISLGVLSNSSGGAVVNKISN